jgi:hypothetical protein
MNKNGFIIGLVFIIIACNSNKKQASAYLENAQRLYEQGEYTTAKSNLDSIKNLFPKEFEIQKQGLALKRKIDLKEQERNLNFCDSMLKVRLAEADTMKTKFVFEKTAYDALGKYLDKSQQVEAKLQSSYIRTVVNELGEIQISSVYCGGRPIHHSQLKVSKANGEYAETAVVPYDGGLNYSFVNGGMTTEVVTYTKGKDNGVIQFIYNNKDATLKAEYLDSGKEKYTSTISTGDKNVLSKIFDFAIVLSDIEKLKQEKEKSSQRLKYLGDRFNGKITESSE